MVDAPHAHIEYEPHTPDPIVIAAMKCLQDFIIFLWVGTMALCSMEFHCSYTCFSCRDTHTYSVHALTMTMTNSALQDTSISPRSFTQWNECQILFDAYELNKHSHFRCFLSRWSKISPSHGAREWEWHRLFDEPFLQRSQLNMVIIYLSHGHGFVIFANKTETDEPHCATFVAIPYINIQCNAARPRLVHVTQMNFCEKNVLYF